MTEGGLGLRGWMLVSHMSWVGKDLSCTFLIHALFSDALVVQSCLTLYDPMDGSLPGSSVHRISQARILESVAIPFSRGYSQHRDQTWVILHCRQILWVMVDLSYFNKLFLELQDYPLVLPLIQSLVGQLRLSMPHGAAKKWKKRRENLRSLVVQWLRLLTPSAGAQVQSLVRELDPTCCN